MLSRDIEDGLVADIQVGETLSLNHLQFADDTLLFYKPNVQELMDLRNLLDDFRFVLG